jgi:RNA polymerase sigma factor (TIGR02999 family)
MSTPVPQDVTQLLLAWSEGDPAALDQLIPLVHAELHRLAKQYLRNERAGHSLQATALVNEAYLRLVDARQIRWQNRAHFFAVSARLIRRILVDAARKRGYRKRGGDTRHVPLDEALTIGQQPDEDLMALHEALCSLAELDARKGQVVEMRFFGGLTVDETAEVLRVSPETVRRDWRLAKSWLRRRLSEEETDDS